MLPRTLNINLHAAHILAEKLISVDAPAPSTDIKHQLLANYLQDNGAFIRLLHTFSIDQVVSLYLYSFLQITQENGVRDLTHKLSGHLKTIFDPHTQKDWKYYQVECTNQLVIRLGVFSHEDVLDFLFIEEVVKDTPEISPLLDEHLREIYLQTRSNVQKTIDSFADIAWKAISILIVLVCITLLVLLGLKFSWNFESVQTSISSSYAVISSPQSAAFFFLCYFLFGLILVGWLLYSLSWSKKVYFFILNTFKKRFLRKRAHTKFKFRRIHITSLFNFLLISFYLSLSTLPYIGMSHAITSFTHIQENSIVTKPMFSSSSAQYEPTQISKATFDVFPNGSTIGIAFSLTLSNKDTVSIIDGNLTDLPDLETLKMYFDFFKKNHIPLEIPPITTLLYSRLNGHSDTLQQEAKEFFEYIELIQNQQ